MFERTGARLWVARAVDEHRRVGLRPSAEPGLTETERRVAELAAQGRRNAEIARDLFLSPKTVEATLSRTYRKLGIRGRAELNAALASG